MDPTGTHNDSDDHLLARLRRGDHAALDEVARRYRPFVFTMAARRLRDQHLAEDVTQTVFERFVPRAARLPDGANLARWLASAVCYCCHETRRAARRRTARELRVAGGAPVAYEQPDPLVAAELRAGISTALGRLKDKDRTAIGLRLDSDLSLAAVGDRLGINRDAAAKRVDRALRRLRGTLERQGVTPETV